MKDKKEEILNYFSKVLNREQDLSPYLSLYFEKEMGFKMNFKPRIEISNLEIIGQDTFKIYQNDFFRNLRTSGPGTPIIYPWRRQAVRLKLKNKYSCKSSAFGGRLLCS